MGHIEAMFYQARIPEMSTKHDAILVVGRQQLNNNQATDHQMYVHVCGCASSPSCCIYALKSTATDNEV